MFVRLSEILAKVLAWVIKAASTDQWRDILFRTVNFQNGWIAACSGWQIHAVKIDNYLIPEELRGGTFRPGKFTATSTVVDMERAHGTYPDLTLPIPKRQPDAEFYVNPKLLINALSGLQSTARICLYKDRGDEFIVPADATPEERDEMLQKRKRKVEAGMIKQPTHGYPSHDPIEVFGNVAGCPAYALIMPVQEGPVRDWKPTPPAPPPAPEPPPTSTE